MAKEFCEQGKVWVNGRVAKASQEVRLGDIIEFRMGPRIIRVEVMISDGPIPRDASEMIKAVEE